MLLRRNNRRCVHHGQALQGALIGMAILGGFALAAVVIQPAILDGAWQNADDDASRLSPDRRETFENLAALIGASAEVIAVHQRGRDGRGGSPFAEIVLRLHDPHESDFIRHEEVAVISHSRVLQTVMVYLKSEPNEDALLTRADVAEPAFCTRWRNHAAVEPRLIAAGVSDLRARLHDRNGGRARLTLELTWPGDSSDANEEAGIVLEVRSRALP